MEVRNAFQTFVVPTVIWDSDYPLLTGPKRLRYHPERSDILMRFWRFVAFTAPRYPMVTSEI
jgi:hypothetical protein